MRLQDTFKIYLLKLYFVNFAGNNIQSSWIMSWLTFGFK